MMRDPVFGAGVRMRGISEGRKPGYFGQARPGSFTSEAEVLVSRPSPPPPQSTETLHHKNWLNVTQLLNFTDDHSGSGIQDWEVILLFGAMSVGDRLDVSLMDLSCFRGGPKIVLEYLILVLEAFDNYSSLLKEASLLLLFIWNE